jgi:hypothetical protein
LRSSRASADDRARSRRQGYAGTLQQLAASAFDIPENEVEPTYDSLRRFWLRLRDPRYQLRRKLDPGEMIAVANARVMHGRDPFDPSTGHRHMQGCLMDMDWVLSTRRTDRAPQASALACVTIKAEKSSGTVEEHSMTDLEKMKSLAAKGKVSRREFIQYALATGMTVAGGRHLVREGGAGGAEEGRVRAHCSGAWGDDGFDGSGHYPDTGTQVPLSGTLSNSLMEVDAKGNVIFDLAESMEPSDDVKTWRFKLKKGLTFHNGKDVTANDVVASFRHHMGPNSKSGAKSLLDAVADVKADGKDTVTFTLKGGNADFPIRDQRLSPGDHAGEGRRHGRLAVGHPHRGIQPGEVRTGGAHQAEAQPALSQGG